MFLRAVTLSFGWLVALKSRVAHAFGHNLLSFWTKRTAAGPYIYVAGHGFYGQLGQGDTLSRSSPVVVGSSATWAEVSAHGSQTLAIRGDGTLWGWGIQDFFGMGSLGVLGVGNGNNYSSPVQVGTLTSWSQVATGYYHTLGLQTNGTLWAWGRSSDPTDGTPTGALGLGDYLTRLSPVQVGTLNAWSEIACGEYYSLAIRSGTLWNWGYIHTGNGPVSSPVQIGTLSSWQKVASFYGSSYAIRTDGTLWAWGSNTMGALGLGDEIPRSSPTQVGSLNTWARVSCGNFYALAIKNDGTLWCWGNNASGQLGLVPAISVSSPVQVGSLTSWSRVSNGISHSIALQTDGTLWAWGANLQGQLCLGTTTARSSPVRVGTENDWKKLARTCNNHSAAIR